MTTIKLFHDWDSLMSFKVRACLAEKNLIWDSHLIALTSFQHLRDDYLGINPNGVVPTLQYDGKIILESSVINEFLNEMHPDPDLVPDNPGDRADMRAWVKYGDDVLHPAVRPATFELMIRPRIARLSPDELERLIADHPIPARAAAFRRIAVGEPDMRRVLHTAQTAQRIFARMQTRLSRTGFLAGDQFTLADVMAMPFIDRIDHLGMRFVLDKFSAVSAWATRLANRPSYACAAPPDGSRLPAPAPDLTARLPMLLHATKQETRK